VRVAFSSQRLAAARVAAGLTQQQIADALGTNKARISEWERGVTQPRASRLPAVARAINVDPLELMADSYEDLDLEALRMAAGLSRQALSAAVGMTLPRYQRLEAGERTSELPEDLLHSLARILSVPLVTVRMAAENSRDQGIRRRYGEHSPY
jgi:transcriptional regulator with XRE-family HTH domain